MAGVGNDLGERVELGRTRVTEERVPGIGADTDNARELSLMVAGADGPHEPVDVGADRPCGVAAALAQVERHDEEDRVPRGRQRHRLGNHAHVLDKTVMLTREDTPELYVAGDSTIDRIAQRSSKQPEWRERRERMFP